MDGALLDHPDLAVALDDLCFDLADFLVHEVAPILLPREDGFARFLHTPRAERISLPRPPQRWLGLFPGLQQRFFRPVWSKRWIGIELIEKLQSIESHARGFADREIDELPCARTRACFPRHVNCLAFRLRSSSIEFVQKNAAKSPCLVAQLLERRVTQEAFAAPVPRREVP